MALFVYQNQSDTSVLQSIYFAFCPIQNVAIQIAQIQTCVTFVGRNFDLFRLVDMMMVKILQHFTHF